ncbi:MAG: hypothetical protein KBE41_02530 [Lutibacter sp.]|nr:hypothetical protein [Lutibacter sp.]MBP9600355.1 hypothetical protein [Lutibacter sp.]
MKNSITFLFLSAILLTSCSSTTGTVKGTVCYPSDYIPAMTVYVKNKETGKINSLNIRENQKTFKFKKIPEGNYVAFAYTVQEVLVDNNNKSIIANGGFTQAVPCGLTVDCKDHSLITFSVKKGNTINNIQICDWLRPAIKDERK